MGRKLLLSWTRECIPHRKSTPFSYICPCSDRLASTSRFLVRTTSPSEAYRLVRKYHMQMFRPESKGDKHTMRAFVVW